MDSLTPREYQVALLVGRGLCNKEIARELHLSDGTVKQHVHNILQKFGATSRYAVLLACGQPPNDRRGAAEALRTRDAASRSD